MRINQRRSEIEIVADMLRLIQKGARKTKIMYHADLSYSQMQKYLSFLDHQGFVVITAPAGSYSKYEITESGLKLLENIDNIFEMLGLYDNNLVYQSIGK